MANEDNAVSQFIDALKSENGNDKLLENLLPQQKEEKQPEGKQDEGQKIEEATDFHKNSKVQKYIDKMVSKKVEQAISNMPKQTQEYLEDNPDVLKALMDDFTKVVGNDTPEKTALLDNFGKTLKGFQDKVLEAQSLVESQNQEKAQEEQAEQELNNSFDEIEEEFGVDLWEEKNRKLKGQFLDYVEDISHKDKDGDIDEFPDIVGAYRSFVKIHHKENTTETAKDLADRSGTKSSSGAGSEKATERITFDNIGDKIDRMFG